MSNRKYNKSKKVSEENTPTESVAGEQVIDDANYNEDDAPSKEDDVKYQDDQVKDNVAQIENISSREVNILGIRVAAKSSVTVDRKYMKNKKMIDKAKMGEKIGIIKLTGF